MEIARLELCKTYLKRSNSSAAKSQKSRPRNREKRCSRDARDGQGVGPAQKPRTGMKKVCLVRTRERQIRKRETCTKKDVIAKMVIARNSSWARNAQNESERAHITAVDHDIRTRKKTRQLFLHKWKKYQRNNRCF